MSTNFPTSVDSYSTKVNGVDDVDASHVNNLQDAVIAIETLLLQRHEVNLLYHSMTHDNWLDGTTFNDIADDSYCAALWNVVHNGNPPDVSGQAGGSTDPFARYFRCTFDQASSQAGLVQFLENKDTVPLRGQSVSISADLWGTNVSNMRMAVIVWTSTADSVTSDVVGTWATGNPTLATNWAYIGTPTSIAVTGTRTRYSIENLSIPTNANNIAIFIWTPDSEASGDLFNVARVQMEVGVKTTNFVARPFQEEYALISRFIQVLDATSNATDIGFGRKSSATGVVISNNLEYKMRTTPTLSHNATGYTAGAPGTTTVALVNLTTNNFFNITGALTLTLASASKTNFRLFFTAGTSWDGTAGDIAVFRIGPDVIAVMDARL